MRTTLAPSATACASAASSPAGSRPQLTTGISPSTRRASAAGCRRPGGVQLPIRAPISAAISRKPSSPVPASSWSPSVYATPYGFSPMITAVAGPARRTCPSPTARRFQRSVHSPGRSPRAISRSPSRVTSTAACCAPSASNSRTVRASPSGSRTPRRWGRRCRRSRAGRCGCRRGITAPGPHQQRQRVEAVRLAHPPPARSTVSPVPKLVHRPPARIGRPRPRRRRPARPAGPARACTAGPGYAHVRVVGELQHHRPHHRDALCRAPAPRPAAQVGHQRSS